MADANNSENKAQGIVTKNMAHHALEVFAEYPEDEPGVDAMFAALESVITHPLPSTAALREALRECANALDAAEAYLANSAPLVDMQPVLPVIRSSAKRARTLLEGDKT